MAKVVLLGTGNPNPDPNHSGPSIAIIVNEIPYLVDFGSNLVRQAAALTPEYGGNLPALEAANLTIGFLTHLHSDHTIGYPDLILTPWVMERCQPLTVYGPKGTRRLTQHILKAYQADIHYRLYGDEPINDQGWRVIVHEFESGKIYQDRNVRVEAFQVNHGNWSNAFGFRFTISNKVIVISGDTAPCDNIRNFSQGADILIHEAYYEAAFQCKDDRWKDYHTHHHTSTVQLSKLAQETKPGLLVLYHTLFWGRTEQDLQNEIAEIYKGEVVIGSDLQVLDI
jgi:ribonuclease BN (tRNA processing enzyme)